MHFDTFSSALPFSACKQILTKQRCEVNFEYCATYFVQYKAKFGCKPFAVIMLKVNVYSRTFCNP